MKPPEFWEVFLFVFVNFVPALTGKAWDNQRRAPVSTIAAASNNGAMTPALATDVTSSTLPSPFTPTERERSGFPADVRSDDDHRPPKDGESPPPDGKLDPGKAGGAGGPKTGGDGKPNPGGGLDMAAGGCGSPISASGDVIGGKLLVTWPDGDPMPPAVIESAPWVALNVEPSLYDGDI
jgi:hypothetical protein